MDNKLGDMDGSWVGLKIATSSGDCGLNIPLSFANAYKSGQISGYLSLRMRRDGTTGPTSVLSKHQNNSDKCIHDVHSSNYKSPYLKVEVII